MSEGSQFIGMLLDKKRQDAQLDYAMRRDRQRQMQEAIQSVGSAATSIAGNMKQAKRDDIANTLMNQTTPPRATAVDPALDAEMKAQFGNQQPATGGAEELQMRMALENHQGRQADRAFDQGMAVTREQRIGQAIQEREKRLAMDLASKTNQKTKDMVTAVGAYTKNMSLLRKNLATASDFDTYNSIAQDMQVLHYGTASAGAKLPELVIPPYQPKIDPLGDSDLNAAQAKVDLMLGGNDMRSLVAAQTALAKEKGRSLPREVTRFQPEYNDLAGDLPEPDSSMVDSYDSPQSVAAAQKRGELSYQEAADILKTRFGISE